MTGQLYRWPDAAKFGRVVPKRKFYEHGSVSAAVRERFVADVDRITWAYKLAESTINLPGSNEVPEIQVVSVTARKDDVSDVVLTAIDKAIKQPVIFEVVTDEGVRMAATVKAGAARWRYYSTDWCRNDSRGPLPQSISLARLHLQLMEPILPAAIRAGESQAGLAARLADISRIEREMAALVRKSRTEPQLNRKVELRNAMQLQQAKLDELMSPITDTTN